MTGRSKPNWCVYVGGPSDGERRIICGLESGTTLVYTPGATPGRRVPHLYNVTQEYQKGAFNEAKARVLRYVGALPEENTLPPPTPSPMLNPINMDGVARKGGAVRSANNTAAFSRLIRPPAPFTPRRTTPAGTRPASAPAVGETSPTP